MKIPYLSYSKEMDFTPDEVWPYIDDPKRVKLWNRYVVEYEQRQKDSPRGVGSCLNAKMKWLGISVTQHGMIITHQPPKKLVIKWKQQDMFIFEEWTLCDMRGDKSRVELSMHIEGGFWEIAFLPFSWPFDNMMGAKMLQDLARALELAHYDTAQAEADCRDESAEPENEVDDVESDLALLELDMDATWDDIKTAYHLLATKFHPDALISKKLHPDMVKFAEARFKRISSAYARLRKLFEQHE